MKNLLLLEEAAQFLFCVFFLYLMDVAWWAYLLLAIGPDIGMLGYLISPKAGAFTYNFLHHKGLALGVFFLGQFLSSLYKHWSGPLPYDFTDLFYVAAILYGHASMDRIFGYGLKFGDNFHHTHLGWIGRMKQASSEQQAGH